MRDLNGQSPMIMAPLQFGDGFRFGCGFIAAGVVFYVILIILFIIAGLLFSLAGISFLSIPNMIPRETSMLLIPGILV